MKKRGIKQFAAIFLSILVVFQFSMLDGFVVIDKAKAATAINTCGTDIIDPGEYELTTDLTCSGENAITISTSGVTLDGKSHTITSDHIYTGINIDTGVDGISISNFTISDTGKGINIWEINNSQVVNNTFNDSTYGIYYDMMDNWSSYDNLISGNIFNRNSYGLRIGGVDDIFTGIEISSNQFISNTSAIIYYAQEINFDSNVLLRNSRDIEHAVTSYDPSTDTNIFTNNLLSHNLGLNRAINFATALPTKVDPGDTINIDLTFKNPAGATCDDCTATVDVYPDETWTVPLVNAGNAATGSFVITQAGTYSIIITVADADDNVTKRIYKIISGDTETRDQTYYLRGINPTHGQPTSFLPSADTKAMTLAEPSVSEEWFCGQWVQNSPDDLPNYPLSNLNSATINSWYITKDGAPMEEMVAEQYVKRDGHIYPENIEVEIPSPKLTYFWLEGAALTPINWNMDYNWSWYWLGVKLIGLDVKWITFPEGETNKSNIVFNYSYAKTPIIKSSSNELVNILSATAPEDDTNNVTLILSTTDLLAGDDHSTDIVLDQYERAFLDYETTIAADGTTTIAATDIDGEETINSVPMALIPDAGSVDVNITTWNDSGDYSKEWTEEGSGTGSADHTVGDLEALAYYKVKIDGTTLNTYQADAGGEISFTYTDYDALKTMTVEETTAPTPTPTPVPSPTPTPTPASSITFANLPGGDSPVNLTDGAIITTNPYVIEVKPQSDDGIEKVEFYGDDNLICTVTEADTDGVYSCSWDTSQPYSTIKIIAYDVLGNTTILTRHISVTPSLYITTLPQTGKGHFD